MPRYIVGVRRVYPILKHISIAILGVISLYLFANVILRYVFAKPFPDDMQIAGLLFAAFVLLSLAPITASGGQIELGSGVVDRLGPLGKTILRIFILLPILGITGVLIYGGFLAAIGDQQSHYQTVSLGIPYWPWRFLTPLGFLLFFLEWVVQLASTIGQILELIDKKRSGSVADLREVPEPKPEVDIAKGGGF